MRGNFTTPVTQDEVNLMVKMYKEGASAASICQVLPYTPHTILSHLRKQGIKIRGKGGYKHPFNERYFQTIDTEEKAYYLGFLMADGCVIERVNSQPAIALQLKDTDTYILEHLKRELAIDHKIEHDDNRGHSNLRLCSATMAEDLKQYGIVPRKTGREIFPRTLIPDELCRHFVRGFFDGDGWITLTSSHGKPNRRLAIGFTGNEKMLNDIKDYITENVYDLSNVSVFRYNDRSKGYDGFSSVTFAKLEAVVAIANWMYRDATILLTRKHNTYLSASLLISSRLNQQPM